MTPAWTISGEDGAALDGARRPAGTAGLSGGTLTLRSLDVDTLEWTQVGGIVPDSLQRISLYLDGIRVFHGTITQRKYVWQSGGGGSGYSLTASGALYRMSKATVSEDATDGTGTTSARPTFTFPAGDLRAMIVRLLEAAPGVAVGDIDDMFPVGRQTFSGGTWLAVLSDLLKPVADAAGWVDYASPGAPRLCIGRRRNMDVLTLQIGVDPIGRIELAPRSELQVTGISLSSASRDTTGQIVYSAQTAGDASQIIAVSGPDVGAFVPPDNLPMVSIQTVDLAGMSPASFLALDSTLLAAITAAEALGATYGWVGGAYGIPASGLATGASTYKIISGQVMDFLKTDYGLVESTQRVTGWLGWYYVPANGFGTGVSALLAAHNAMFYSAGTTGVFSIYYDVTIPVINLAWPVLTDVYAKAAYEYLTPPVGMAQGMLAAANFIPYEGAVALNPGFAWQRFLSRRLNVLNADPNLATAGAIVQSATVALASGAVELRCGAPQRASMNSLVTRYSASAKDNIALL